MPILMQEQWKLLLSVQKFLTCIHVQNQCKDNKVVSKTQINGKRHNFESRNTSGLKEW